MSQYQLKSIYIVHAGVGVLNKIDKAIIESQRQKTYLRTCALSEDSDQHAHLRSLIRIVTGRISDSQRCKVYFSITKTYLYNFEPLKPHFYIVKLGFTGVYISFLISAQKHRLWVLVRTASRRRF